MCPESAKSAMPCVTTELLEAVDKCIAVHTAPVTTLSASRPSSELGSGVAFCLVVVNCLQRLA